MAHHIQLEATQLLVGCILHLATATVINYIYVSEVDLHKKLFTDYNDNVIPHYNKSTPQKVTVDIYLMSVDRIDEKAQSITIRSFLEVKWKDDFLTWSLADYPGITRINVNEKDLWMPDLALQGTFDKPTDLGQEGEQADIKDTGIVTIWPYKTHTVPCQISITYFPFDKQTCEFDFLSWTNPSSVIVLDSSQEKPGKSYFIESGEWTLVDSSVRHERRPYGEDYWDHVIFVFELERKAFFHVMNIILPVMCIAILNVLCFVLPSEGGERVTLAISIFLTLAVFLTVVNSSMPESSDEVAYFSVYVGLQLFGNTFTILLTIMSLYFFYKESNNEVPCVFRALVRLGCVSTPEMTYQMNGSEITLSRKNDECEINENSSEKKNNPSNVITWRMVSIAVDRLCLVTAICWHVILLVGMGISINSN